MEDGIQNAIDKGPDYTQKYWEMTMEDDDTQPTSERWEVLEFWGYVDADILEENVDASWNLSDKANERCRTNPRSRAIKIGQKKSGALLANQYKGKVK